MHFGIRIRWLCKGHTFILFYTIHVKIWRELVKKMPMSEKGRQNKKEAVSQKEEVNDKRGGERKRSG